MIYRGDCREVLKGLAERGMQFQTVVTSPPYWGLRDYGVEGQIGLEKTPEEYIEVMVGVFRLVRDVLRDDGTLWLNIGDSYATGSSGQNGGKGSSLTPHKKYASIYRPKLKGYKSKDLVGIPWMLAFALRADGWYLRSDIIWDKPNPMPESVKDRPTKSHEYIFLLTKKPQYFFDAWAIKNPSIEPDQRREKAQPIDYKRFPTVQINGVRKRDKIYPMANAKTVWRIATQSYKEAHFATFPEKLVEPCILAGTSEHGCCQECGAPWDRIIEPSKEYAKHLGKSMHDHSDDLGAGMSQKHPTVNAEYLTKGWEQGCKCVTGDPIPCTILDPFDGSGTTRFVAEKLGRFSVGVELNPEYIELGKTRTAQPSLFTQERREENDESRDQPGCLQTHQGIGSSIES